MKGIKADNGEVVSELLESLEKHEFECSPNEGEKYDKEDDFYYGGIFLY